MRSFLRIVAPALVAVAAACSTADPTQLRGSSGYPDQSEDPTDPAPAHGSTTDSGAHADGGVIADAAADATLGDGGVIADAAADAAKDGAVEGGTLDAGSDAGPTNAFTGAGAYTSKTGTSARKNAHNFAGNTPTTNPAKQACLGCHVAGGAAPAFSFGGTVFKDTAGTMPASNVEIRVRDLAGNAVSVYSDADGNFYYSGAFGFPAHTGARDGTTTKLMSTLPGNGNCNSNVCHGGAQGWIHVP